MSQPGTKTCSRLTPSEAILYQLNVLCSLAQNGDAGETSYMNRAAFAIISARDIFPASFWRMMNQKKSFFSQSTASSRLHGS